MTKFIEKVLKIAFRMKSHLMSVSFAEERPCKDENVGENTKEVKNTEDGDETEERTVQVKFVLSNYNERHNIALKSKKYQARMSMRKLVTLTNNSNRTNYGK